MSLAKAIANFIAAQPGREASRVAIIEQFTTRWQPSQVKGAINTAQRNGWITQSMRRRPAHAYARTDVPLSARYRAPGTRSRGGDESELINTERTWARLMVGRYEDAASSVRARSVGRQSSGETSRSLTGSAAAMCAGMLR